MYKFANKIISDHTFILSAILILSVMPKIGFLSFSFTLISLVVILFTPFICYKIFINHKIDIFKDPLFIIFFFIFLGSSITLLINGFNPGRNLFNYIKYQEIFIYLLIYLNAKYIVSKETINHNIILNVVIFIFFIFLSPSILSIFKAISYLEALSFDLMLSDYTLKMNGLNDYTINILTLDLIQKGTTSTNLSYVFAFLNIYLIVCLFKLKKYSKVKIIFLNIIFIIYSLLVFHNTIYLTIFPILLAIFTFSVYKSNNKIKLILFLLFISICSFIFINIQDLGFLNKITNVIKSAVQNDNPRIRIWTTGIDLVSNNFKNFIFGVMSPELFVGYDFFESLFLDSFVKFGLINLVFISILIFYIIYNTLLKSNIFDNDENVDIYVITLILLMPSFIMNNFFNSNMIFSELFAPIFFHIFGIINNTLKNNEV